MRKIQGISDKEKNHYLKRGMTQVPGRQKIDPAQLILCFYLI